jgi:hypothetical protein
MTLYVFKHQSIIFMECIYIEPQGVEHTVCIVGCIHVHQLLQVHVALHRHNCFFGCNILEYGTKCTDKHARTYIHTGAHKRDAAALVWIRHFQHTHTHTHTRIYTYINTRTQKHPPTHMHTHTHQHHAVLVWVSHCRRDDQCSSIYVCICMYVCTRILLCKNIYAHSITSGSLYFHNQRRKFNNTNIQSSIETTHTHTQHTQSHTHTGPSSFPQCTRKPYSEPLIKPVAVKLICSAVVFTSPMFCEYTRMYVCMYVYIKVHANTLYAAPYVTYA